jgi:pimeloyl-ACP methyl ester carboxylesterase
MLKKWLSGGDEEGEDEGGGEPRGGGPNSTVAGLATHPFNPFDEFKDEYRVIAADLRNAEGGQSSGPLETDRPWDAYTDDHIGLMDHLGVRDFMVLGFCIGGPFIWNLLKRTGDRVVAAVPAQPSGYRPEMPDLSALPALACAHYVLARAKSDDLGGNK